MERLSKKAERYLKLIGKSEEAAIRLTRRDCPAADELLTAELAISIPISTGGAEICLTHKGLQSLELIRGGGR